MGPLVKFVYIANLGSGFVSCITKNTDNMDVNPTVDPYGQQEEEFSIDSLPKTLEAFQRRQQLETLEKIIIENS